MTVLQVLYIQELIHNTHCKSNQTQFCPTCHGSSNSMNLFENTNLGKQKGTSNNLIKIKFHYSLFKNTSSEVTMEIPYIQIGNIIF